VNGWTETAYGDPTWYLAQRAETIARLGPQLEPGDTVLDLACGDGALGEHLPAGVRYLGVDGDADMVATALARGRHVVHADLNDYIPPNRVAATTCFRAIYYARDRGAFFERVRSYTDKKFVFDLNPRQYRVADIRADALAAGFRTLELQPLFVSQRFAVAPPLARALRALERVRPIAHMILRLRFTYVCAATC
jgi:hypothetical protein